MKNLKQITAVVILTIAFIGNIFAQDNAKTNLWKIEGDNIKTSYLFGTIHLLPQKDFKITDKVQKAFDACDKVALELDMADAGFQTEVMKHSVLKTGEELKTYLDDEEYVVLDNYFKEKTGVGMANYNKFKPFMLMSIIMVSAFEEQLASYEMTFVEMTKKANKDMEGLESFEDQIKVVDAEPYDEQLDTLVEMIEDPEKNATIYKTVLDLYLAEDIDGLYNYMDEFMDGDIEAMKRFLDDRNNNWIPKFAEYSKDNAVFYAVGGAHLGGEQGVINLLKKAGYTLTPVLK